MNNRALFDRTPIWETITWKNARAALSWFAWKRNLIASQTAQWISRVYTNPNLLKTDSWNRT